jgi:hypothetical protein
MYYKHVKTLARVVNYAPRCVYYALRVMLRTGAWLTYDSRDITYDYSMLIVEATDKYS